MRWMIRRCKICDEYTLRSRCPKCGGETYTPIPPHFSPEDKYLRYKVERSAANP